MLPTDELREALDSKMRRWDGVDVGGSRVFSLTDYDYPDRHLLRSFCTESAIPWSAFDSIRRGKVSIDEEHAKNIEEEFAKLTSSNSNGGDKSNNDGPAKTHMEGGRNILEEPVTYIGKLFEKLLPGLCVKKKDALHRGATFLMFAVVSGDIELATRCVKLRANPNNMEFLSDPDVFLNQMRHGYSPMFIAVITGKLEMMSLLQESGGSIHVYDRWGRSLLQAAVAIGDRDVVQWLLSRGAPRCIGSGVTTLPDTIEFSGATQTNLALLRRPQPCENPEEAALCHCHSKRPKAYCGCVDDMFLRWSLDRLHTRWFPGVDLSELAAAHMTSTRNQSSGE